MSPRRAGLLTGLLLVPVALVLGLAARDSRDQAAESESAYVLLQMNLCLSGRAGCFAGVRYPLGVRDAADLIKNSGADVVTLSEVCRGDVENIAAETGFHARFAPVASYVLPDDCVDPGGRGVFGIALLTRTEVLASVGRPYVAQDKSIEQRRWLCVTTDEARVCTTHLEIRGRQRLDEVNDAQCAEFARVLQRLGAARPVIAAGDLNRDGPCSAPGMWVATDRAAEQAPGKQHAYASTAFAEPRTGIIALRYSDHDALVVTSRLQR